MGNAFFGEDFMAWAVLLGVFGPVLVATITGLKTPSWVKACIALSIVVGFTIFQLWQSGWLYTGTIVNKTVVMVVTWQAFYGMLWKGTGISRYLQEKIPIKLGQVVDVEPVAPE